MEANEADARRQLVRAQPGVHPVAGSGRFLDAGAGMGAATVGIPFAPMTLGWSQMRREIVLCYEGTYART
jgi:hypothetical protein